MLSAMALQFSGKANNICKEAQIVKRNFGHLQILFTYAPRKSVLWICVKRVGICKSSRFQNVTSLISSYR